MNTKQTIEDLFSDSGPFDEAAVVEALKPFVTIQKSTNEIFFKNSSPTAEQRILLYGLAKKLLRTKGLLDNEMITAQEVREKTGIKKGTIDPLFKKLKETGYLVGKGQYEIPTPRVSDVIRRLQKS
jgi:predicted transcriptional regulator